MNIKRVREQLGMTQKALAEVLKVSESLVSRWEAGTRQVPDKTQNTLSRMYVHATHTRVWEPFDQTEYHREMLRRLLKRYYRWMVEKALHNVLVRDSIPVTIRVRDCTRGSYIPKTLRALMSDGAENLHVAIDKALSDPLKLRTKSRHKGKAIPFSRQFGLPYFVKRAKTQRPDKPLLENRYYAEQRRRDNRAENIMPDEEFQAKVERDGPNAALMELEHRRELKSWNLLKCKRQPSDDEGLEDAIEYGARDTYAEIDLDAPLDAAENDESNEAEGFVDVIEDAGLAEDDPTRRETTEETDTTTADMQVLLARVIKDLPPLQQKIIQAKYYGEDLLSIQNVRRSLKMVGISDKRVAGEHELALKTLKEQTRVIRKAVYEGLDYADLPPTLPAPKRTVKLWTSTTKPKKPTGPSYAIGWKRPKSKLPVDRTKPLIAKIVWPVKLVHEPAGTAEPATETQRTAAASSGPIRFSERAARRLAAGCTFEGRWAAA